MGATQKEIIVRMSGDEALDNNFFLNTIDKKQRHPEALSTLSYTSSTLSMTKLIRLRTKNIAHDAYRGL